MTTTTHDNGFTQVLNSLITDRRVSAAAFRIALYLASKPDGWITREANVMQALGIGRDQYRRALRELEAADMLKRGKTSKDRASGRILTEPPTLRRDRVCPVRPEGWKPGTGNQAPVTSPVTNTGEQHLTVLPKTGNPSSVSAELPKCDECRRREALCPYHLRRMAS